MSHGQRVLRIGTRGSALARAQAALVATALSERGARSELVVIETAGDRRQPDTAWGEGAFVSAIERAVLAGSVDLAVHSAKDLPTDEDPSLRIIAYLPRESALDALVVPIDARGGGTIDTLAPAASIGTDSPRRAGFLRARRGDLRVQPLHGNVDTRLRRLDAGEVDALVVAAAGLRRLGKAERISQLIPADVVPPAAGQGALAVQARADDAALDALGSDIDDPATRIAVEAERACLAAMGGGCRAPTGVLGTVADGELRLLAGFATVDGAASAFADVRGPLAEAKTMALRLAEELVRRRMTRAGGRRVLITRPADLAGSLIRELAGHAIGAVVVPTIAIEAAPDRGPVEHAVARLGSFDWAVVTSVHGAAAVLEAADRLGADLRQTRWAAVGDASARALRRRLDAAVWQPGTPSGRALAAELPLDGGESVAMFRGQLADAAVTTVLEERGATVLEVCVYLTVEAPSTSLAPLRQALRDDRLSGVILSSPSQVRGLLALAGSEFWAQVTGLPAICIGSTTASAARELGFTDVAQASSPSAAAVTELAVEKLLRVPAGLS